MDFCRLLINRNTGTGSIFSFLSHSAREQRIQKIPFGFTLIELLVVMSIIAILLTIAVPRYFGSVDRSKEVALRQNLNVMRDAIDKFKGDTGSYPATIDELVAKKYLRSIPVDPLTDSATTWQVILPPDGKLNGVYDIKSGSNATARDGSNFRDW